jgi:hypothetical protein
MGAARAHEFDLLVAMTMRLAGDNARNGFDVTSPARLGNSAIVGSSSGLWRNGEHFRY